jgi:hypothetical protein
MVMRAVYRKVEDEASGLKIQGDEEKAGIDCRINEKKGAGRKREKEIRADPMNHLMQEDILF